ncbi:hypothetical protein QYE76_033740 [Lolium multiflorum]|uniref:BED-type domain-containing protein n=1 Tax=Lolium multiflorum TaxID=4521 RepID=A0AAD8VJK1_LOLMU|nr:hypothetical protein QYE76_033740 [Lolium multiflorum]
MTQLQNKPVRKVAPIVSRSPMINRMARQRAQSHGSPNSHAISPTVAATLKLPSLHDLSPTATNGTAAFMHDLSPTATNGTPASMHDPSPTPTNGSKRRPRKLTSKIWKDAEPIYVGGLLMQGRCKYCNNVFPASKVSGTSQLGRHLKAHIKLKVARCRNELQQYVEEGFHPCTPDFNILKWWDVNSERYPILGNMARDVLAVPASTVASESAFSACGRVITDHRSSLAPETIEALMCYGDWIRSRKPTNAGQENRCEEQRVVDHLVSGT